MVSKIDKNYSIYAIENILPEKNGMYDLLDINNEFIKGLHKIQSDDAIKVTASIQGRLDVVSMDKYGTTNLWWIIAVYNRLSNISSFDIEVIKLPNIIELNNLIQQYKG